MDEMVSAALYYNSDNQLPCPAFCLPPPSGKPQPYEGVVAEHYDHLLNITVVCVKVCVCSIQCSLIFNSPIVLLCLSTDSPRFISPLPLKFRSLLD